MREPCVVCGETASGIMRSRNDLWYCAGGFTSDRNCFDVVFDERETYIEILKVRLDCPFCEKEITEAYEKGERRCPFCRTEFNLGYEEQVTFIRPREEKFVVREEQ